MSQHTTPELCAKCGERLHPDPLRQARLCPRHLQEAIAATPPFVDGTRVTAGTAKCMCDGPCFECAPGKPRKDCPHCEGTGKRLCEFPCWQRLGLTSEPCCPSCPPLPDPDPQPAASVTSLEDRHA